MNDVLDKKYKGIYEYYKAQKPTSKTLVCVAGVSEGAFRWYESLSILTQEIPLHTPIDNYRALLFYLF